MITITCTNCQTSLTIDEAFAGGVCRCQHCGTIQTVPKSARAGVVSGAAPGGSKTLWKQKTASDTQAGTGLDELADIVASSGLAGSGLQSGGLRKKTPPPPAARGAGKKLVPILAGAGAAVVVLVVVLVFLSMNGQEPASPAGPQSGRVNVGGVDPMAVKIEGPSFANVDLSDAGTVAYVLDRGSGTQVVFGDLRGITLKSITSLGGDRKFQVLFWEKGGEVVAYPAGGTNVGGETSIGEATRKLDEVNAFGSTNVVPALKKAAAVNPDVIVLATGKGADLDESFREQVKANRPANCKIHTINLGDNEAPILKAIAAETGGEYQVLTISELNALR